MNMNKNLLAVAVLLACTGANAQVNAVDTTNTLVNQVLDPLVSSMDPVTGPLTSALDPVLSSLGSDVTTPLVDSLQEPLSPVVQSLDEGLVTPLTQSLAPVTDPVLQTLDPVVNISNEVAALKGSDSTGLLDGVYEPLTSGGFSSGVGQLETGSGSSSANDLNVFATASNALWGTATPEVQTESGAPDYVTLTAETRGSAGARVQGEGAQAGVDEAQIESTATKTLSKVGQRLVLNNVNFETSKSVLTPQARSLLDRVAQVIAQLPKDYKFTIAGFTDSVGSVVSNQRLSQARATSVMTYLVSKGIGAGQLSSTGFGEARPIADNNTVEGRAQNRRVEISRAK